MSLLNALNQAKSGNFGENNGLKPGTYQCDLDGVIHGYGKHSNTGYLRFRFEVLDGEEAGKHESWFPYLYETYKSGKEVPEFVLARNIYGIESIAKAVGLNLSDDVFASDDAEFIYETIADNFKDYLGKPVEMKIVERPNKKDPSRPYRNYYFQAGESIETPEVNSSQDPFSASKNDSVEISDSDLPF